MCADGVDTLASPCTAIRAFQAAFTNTITDRYSLTESYTESLNTSQGECFACKCAPIVASCLRVYAPPKLKPMCSRAMLPPTVRPPERAPSCEPPHAVLRVERVELDALCGWLPLSDAPLTGRAVHLHDMFLPIDIITLGMLPSCLAPCIVQPVKTKIPCALECFVLLLGHLRSN